MANGTRRALAVGASVALAYAAMATADRAAAPDVAAHHAATAPVAAAASGGGQGGGHGGGHGGYGRPDARATLRLADGRAVGRVAMWRAAGGRTAVSVHVEARRLREEGGTFHGFHVHANDDPANGRGCVASPDAPPSTWFVSADGHYTEPGEVHGNHLGDLPVLYLDERGKARASFVTDRFTPWDVIGRAVILHALPDNYNNIPTGSGPEEYTPNSPAATQLTDETGNAGDRVACGLVRR